MKLLMLVVLAGFGAVCGTRVRKCGTDGPLVEDPNIHLSSCEKIPCILKRNTTTTVELKFQPQTEIAKVKTNVNANILGVPFPFIGVDGNVVCDKVFDPKGAKTGCSLARGSEYVYKDSFKVLPIYPKIKVWVHWAIVDEAGKDVICFEVPVKITN